MKPTTTEVETEDMVVTEMVTNPEEVKMELIQSKEEIPTTTPAPTTRAETREEEETMTTMIMMIMVIMMMKLITTAREVAMVPEAVTEAATTNVAAIEEVTTKTSKEVARNPVASLEIETRATGRRTSKRDLNQSQLKPRKKREFFTSTT